MNALEHLIRTFYPPKCIVCEEATGHFSTLPYCDSCYAELMLAKLFEASSNELPFVDGCYKMFDYQNDAVKNSVFHAKKAFSPLFANFYSECAMEMLSLYGITQRINLITFATRRVSEKNREGLDQAEQMAKAISKITAIPYCQTLVRTRSSAKQRELSHAQRAVNVKNLFKATSDLHGKKILLVDDVMTTGSTLSDCARALKCAGAKEVYVMVFAK